MTEVNRLHEEDFLAWSEQQAGALRAAAREGSNHALDWRNLAEEIEGLGISQRSALRSQIRRIIRHLLKLEYSRASDPRRGWIESIGDARAEVEDLLETSPSLRSQLHGEIAAQTKRAIELVIQDLRGHEEIDATRLPHLRDTTLTEEQILGDWIPKEPRS